MKNKNSLALIQASGCLQTFNHSDLKNIKGGHVIIEEDVIFVAPIIEDDGNL